MAGKKPMDLSFFLVACHNDRQTLNNYIEPCKHKKGTNKPIEAPMEAVRKGPINKAALLHGVTPYYSQRLLKW